MKSSGYQKRLSSHRPEASSDLAVQEDREPKVTALWNRVKPRPLENCDNRCTIQNRLGQDFVSVAKKSPLKCFSRAHEDMNRAPKKPIQLGFWNGYVGSLEVSSSSVDGYTRWDYFCEWQQMASLCPGTWKCSRAAVETARAACQDQGDSWVYQFSEVVSNSLVSVQLGELCQGCEMSLIY